MPLLSTQAGRRLQKTPSGKGGLRLHVVHRLCPFPLPTSGFAASCEKLRSRLSADGSTMYPLASFSATIPGCGRIIWRAGVDQTWNGRYNTSNRRTNAHESENQVRQRCYQCFRPMSLCFCEAIPRIDNRTDVLILQHVGERFHPFNTARIVQKALRRCRLIVDHNRRLAAQHLPIRAGAGVLYPQANARSLTELPAAERPTQLVIIDGTWHQAKTIVRDVAQLRDLPCYRLTPSAAGQYRIRREPNAHSLSTLEATVAALQALEPDTAGLDRLLAAFNKMVENQLAHPASHAVPRYKENRQSRPRYLPRALLQNPERLVVAYGEATPGGPGRRTAAPLPVHWVAQRLGTSERFSCRLRQQQPLSDAALKHIRLSAADFDDAVSRHEFCHRWNHFVDRNDVLIVYHHRTYQLLRHIGASQPHCLVLKSIFGKWRAGFRCLEELMAIEGLTLPSCEHKSRANQRLDMALASVEHLRTRYGKLTASKTSGTGVSPVV